MAGKYGVEQTSKIVLFVADLANVGEKLTHGGGVISFFQLGPELISLAALDVASFKQEIAELDPDDEAKILAAFKQKLDLANDKLELEIESVADLVIQVANTLASVVGFVKSLKA